MRLKTKAGIKRNDTTEKLWQDFFQTPASRLAGYAKAVLCGLFAAGRRPFEKRTQRPTGRV